MTTDGHEVIRFFFDENVNRDVAEVLVNAGHEVIYSTDVLVAGTADQLVANVALSSSYILVTHDKDFKNLERLLNATDLSSITAGAGKLQLLKIDEIAAIERIRENLDRIEFEYARCIRLNQPFFMSISKTVVRMNDQSPFNKRKLR